MTHIQHNKTILSLSSCLLLLLAGILLQGCPAPHSTRKGGQALMVHTVQQQAKRTPWRSLLPAKKRTLVVFMTTWCESCERKQPAVLRWARRSKENTKTLFIVSGSPHKEVSAMTKKRKIPGDLVVVVSDNKGDVAKRYEVRATPTYVLLGPSGKKTIGRYSSLKQIPSPPK